MPSSGAATDTHPALAAVRRSATKDLPARRLQGAGIACLAVLALGQPLFASYLAMFYGRAALGGIAAAWMALWRPHIA